MIARLLLCFLWILAVCVPSSMCQPPVQFVRPAARFAAPRVRPGSGYLISVRSWSRVQAPLGGILSLEFTRTSMFPFVNFEHCEADVRYWITFQYRLLSGTCYI